MGAKCLFCSSKNSYLNLILSPSEHPYEYFQQCCLGFNVTFIRLILRKEHHGKRWNLSIRLIPAAKYWNWKGQSPLTLMHRSAVHHLFMVSVATLLLPGQLVNQ